MRLIAVFALILAIFVSLAACGGGSAENEYGETIINREIIEGYVYLAESLDMAHLAERIDGVTVHEGRIYYFYSSADAEHIVVESLRPDGGGLTRIELPSFGDAVDIAALRFTDVGNMALLLTSIEWTAGGSDMRVWYAEYSPQGAELLRREMVGLIPEGVERFQINRAIWADDGHLVLLTNTERGSSVYLLDEQLRLRAQLEGERIHSLSQTGDGRVMVAKQEVVQSGWRTVLREIDLAAGGWGESFPISVESIRDMFPAQPGDGFDLYIDDDTYLLGYNLATGEQTLLLNWVEVRAHSGFGHVISFLPDSSISVLNSEWRRDGDGFQTRLLLLTRTSRANLPDVEVITLTLGGFNLHGDIAAQVRAFNENSLTHQIQLRDYARYDDGATRFLLELATGGGPDIIWGALFQLSSWGERGVLFDLYELIDADPELNRTDFFPNVLQALEISDGTLPLLVDRFHIRTLVGTEAHIGPITSWTPGEMLRLFEQAPPQSLPFGALSTVDFLRMLVTLEGQGFIDREAGTANLGSEAFIHLLEVAVLLERNSELPGHLSEHDIVRMLAGEQLVMVADISAPYHILIYQALGDVQFLGMPTAGGGAHLIQSEHSFGINRASAHVEDAWGFLRQLLLPDAPIIGGLPLRIDMFEGRMLDAMTPLTWVDEEGEEQIINRGGISWGDEFIVWLYAITEEEADKVRHIVTTASLLDRWDGPVMMMIEEELLPLLHGDRTAADTARILQNRIQMYLSERG